MPHLELWQWLAAFGGALVMIDRGFTAAARLGMIPQRFLKWIQKRWLQRLEDEARERALDALLTNGISHKLDIAAGKADEAARKAEEAALLAHEHAALIAEHIEESRVWWEQHSLLHKQEHEPWKGPD